MTEKVKGSLIIARMKFLRTHGDPAVEQVMELLTPEDRRVLTGILLPATWYEEELQKRLELAMVAVLAGGDRRDCFVRMGRFSAETHLGPNGLQRAYVRPGNPQHVLKSVPRMYMALHDTGNRTYERTGAQSAIIRSFDAEKMQDDCMTTVGWLERAIELSGGKVVHVLEPLCRAEGAELCEYHCDWE